jgi:hypothetical protein
VYRWAKEDKMHRIKFFRKNGRVCEEGLNENQLLDMRDKLLQGYNEVSSDDEVEVVSQAPSRLSAKQKAEMDRLIAQRLKNMVPDVAWSKPKRRCLLLAITGLFKVI